MRGILLLNSTASLSYTYKECNTVKALLPKSPFFKKSNNNRSEREIFTFLCIRKGNYIYSKA